MSEFIIIFINNFIYFILPLWRHIFYLLFGNMGMANTRYFLFLFFYVWSIWNQNNQNYAIIWCTDGNWSTYCALYECGQSASCTYRFLNTWSFFLLFLNVISQKRYSARSSTTTGSRGAFDTIRCYLYQMQYRTP